MITSLKRNPVWQLHAFIVIFLLAAGTRAHADPIAAGTDETPAPTNSISAPSSDFSSNLKVTGFLSIVGGNIYNGSFAPNYLVNGGATKLNGVACPCFIADYSNAGVYGSTFSFKPETHGGIQLQYTFSPDLNFVGQVTAHTQEDTPAIQWAYFNYRVNENWEVHVGRQRIPMYYYSQFQDVGFAYPWIDPPPELYGWEATNYDGASVRYTNSFGDVNFTSSGFTGIEKLGHSQFYKTYLAGDTDVEWSAIAGVDAEINKGPLTVRAVYLQANTSIINTNALNPTNSYSPMKTYGVAANLDFDSWFVLSEVTQQVRDYIHDGYKLTSPASTIGAGYRWGKWTPFINYGIFTMHYTNQSIAPAPGDYKRASLTLRYDIDSSSDLKIQLDRNYDASNDSFGNTNVARLSYDKVF